MATEATALLAIYNIRTRYSMALIPRVAPTWWTLLSLNVDTESSKWVFVRKKVSTSEWVNRLRSDTQTKTESELEKYKKVTARRIQYINKWSTEYKTHAAILEVLDRLRDIYFLISVVDCWNITICKVTKWMQYLYLFTQLFIQLSIRFFMTLSRKRGYSKYSNWMQVHSFSVYP